MPLRINWMPIPASSRPSTRVRNAVIAGGIRCATQSAVRSAIPTTATAQTIPSRTLMRPPGGPHRRGGAEDPGQDADAPLGGAVAPREDDRGCDRAGAGDERRRERDERDVD